MNVRLSGNAERFVRQQVDSGRYESTQAVVRESLRLLREQALVEEQRRIRLDEQIGEGLAELERGEGIPGDQVLRALRDKSQKRRQQSS